MNIPGQGIYLIHLIFIKQLFRSESVLFCFPTASNNFHLPVSSYILESFAEKLENIVEEGLNCFIFKDTLLLI